MDVNIPACNAIPNCTLPVDVVLKSSDGARFGGHLSSLSRFNTAFPTVDGTITHRIEDEVALAETGDVLKLLVKYSHGEHSDSIPAGVGIDAVIGLAVAADKYGNSFAALAAKWGIEKRATQTPANALKVMIYKAKSNDVLDIDNVARMAMKLPLEIVSPLLKDRLDIHFIFAQYRDKYQRHLEDYRITIGYDPSEHDYDYDSKDEFDYILVMRGVMRDSLNRGEHPTINQLRLAAGISRRVSLGAADDDEGDGYTPVLDDWWEEMHKAISRFPKWADFVM